jgi:hypothetical protein
LNLLLLKEKAMLSILWFGMRNIHCIVLIAGIWRITYISALK